MRGHKLAIRLLSEALHFELKRWLKTAHYEGVRPFSTFTFLWEYPEYAYIMGRKSSKQPDAPVPSGRADGGIDRWLNVSFTDADIEVIRSWASEQEALALRLAAVLGSGSDFSVRYDKRGSNYRATLIMQPGGYDDIVSGVSGYADDVWTAIAACLYKWALFQSYPERFSYGSGKPQIG